MTNATRAKRALALFLSESYQLPLYAVEDLIDETQEICDRVRFYNDYSLYTRVDQVVEDYLGLSAEHCWMFRETSPCYKCDENLCNRCIYSKEKKK